MIFHNEGKKVLQELDNNSGDTSEKDMLKNKCRLPLLIVME